MVILKRAFSVRPSIARLAGAGRGFTRVVSAIIFALTSLAFSVTYSFQHDQQLYRGGLCNSNGNHSLNQRQLQAVIESLRRKTGFLEMRLDQAGCLTLGDRRPVSGGSPTARELLIDTVEGNRLFKLESHNNSPHIAFAQLSGNAIYENHRLKTRVEVRLLQVDFADFSQLRGSDEALASFDVGFSILHELAHGVWRLPDALDDQGRVGSCEERINCMRRELGLPERQSYYASVCPAPGPGGAILQVELLFALTRHESGRAGVRKFYLRWDADRVAGPDSSALRRMGHAPAAAQR
jgi:hypothetical protein